MHAWSKGDGAVKANGFQPYPLLPGESVDAGDVPKNFKDLAGALGKTLQRVGRRGAGVRDRSPEALQEGPSA